MHCRYLFIVVVLLAPCFGGCASSRARYWKPAEFARPIRTPSAPFDDASIAEDPEAAYKRARDLEAANSDACVDWYFQVAKRLWPAAARIANNELENDLRSGDAFSDVGRSEDSQLSPSRSGQLYQSAVGKLVTAGEAFNRLDPRTGLRVYDVVTGETRMVPVMMRGFAWAPHELRDFEVVGDYKPPLPTAPKREPGIGVPILIHPSCSRPYIFPSSVIAATAVLHPIDGRHTATASDATLVSHSSSNVPSAVGPSAIGSHGEPPFTDSTGTQVATAPLSAAGGRQNSSGDEAMTLDIIGTATVRTLHVGGRSLPIAADMTAPLAFLRSTTERHWMQGFAHPDQVETELGLSMISPYEPGKIPVVLIHGLASDEWTWAAMANELFSHPDLMRHFQFWVFSYPTGTAFPSEAANLRHDLVDLRRTIDPNHRDPALDNIVLIGHSMGGLVAKMQICTSDDRILESIFKKPLSEIDMTDELRQHFERIARFHPSPQVRRVIFIGTPHRGSKLASGSAGKLASKLVQFSNAEFDRATDFLAANQESLLVPIRRIPTSVDLLRPDNEILQAVYSLPVNPKVHLHSIIGVGHKSRFGKEVGDGVVPISSARLPNVMSELLVEAGHGLHNDPATFAEVIRILREHARRDTGQQASVATQTY